MPSIAMAAAAGLVFASVLMWGAAWDRWRSGLPLVPAAPPCPAPWGLADLAVAAAIWLFVNLAVLAATSALTGTDPGTAASQSNPASQRGLLLLGAIAMLVVCLLVTALLWARHRVTASEMGWDPRHLAGDALLGMRAFIMLAPIVYSVQWVLTRYVEESRHPLIELLKEHPDPAFFVAAGFAAAVVAPVAEEFLFRLLLQGWLERVFSPQPPSAEILLLGGRTDPEPQAKQPPGGDSQEPSSADAAPPAPSAATDSPRQPTSLSPPDDSPQSKRLQLSAIAVSSLCFALSHWSHGPDPIPLFVFALGLGYLYHRTHRLAPCIVLHFLLNVCSLFALWMIVTQ